MPPIRNRRKSRKDAVGVKVPHTMTERLLILLSRYREASIAVVAIVLVIYFQIGSDGGFLSPQFMSVVLRDTGRLGLIAVAEVDADDHRRDRSVAQRHLLDRALYHGAAVGHLWRAAGRRRG